MECKEYEKLNFDSLYKQKNYPKKTWPILNEYFSRYKSEFELNDDEIIEKCNKVIDNLDVIKKSGTIRDFWNGVYKCNKKEININVDRMRICGLSNEQVLNTVFHELNHAGEDMDKLETNTSFQLYNPVLNKYEGTALNEIITEMKASRLACNDRAELLKKSGDDRSSLNLVGYGDLIFIGTMVHTAFGLGEKEFLQLADKGKVEFDKQMRGKFPPGDATYDNFMKSITFYSDMLHTIKYNGSREYTNEDKINIANSINGIRDHCLYAMEKRMSYEAFKNRDNINMKEFNAKSRYELEKIEINYKKGMAYDLPKEAVQDENVYKDKVKRKIMAYETIDKQRNKLDFSQYSELLYLSSEGDDITNKLESEYGIYTSKDINEFDKTMELEYETKLLKEEYGEKPWDNENVLKDVKKFSKDNPILNMVNEYVKGWKTISRVIKDIINDYKEGNEWKRLPEAKLQQMEESQNNEYKEKNGIIQDLSDMVKSDEEYINDKNTTKEQQIQEKDTNDYIGLE